VAIHQHPGRLRSRQFNIRLTPEEYDYIAEAARRAKLKVSDFARRVLVYGGGPAALSNSSSNVQHDRISPSHDSYVGLLAERLGLGGSKS
jgi:hypothetical protein